MATTNDDDNSVWSDDDDNAYGYAFCTVSSSTKEGTEIGHIHQQDGTIRDVSTSSFNKQRASVIPVGSIGLDSMSSVDIFGNKELLRNIRTVDNTMTVICNAGVITVNQMGCFDGYGEVWYHPQAIANILSLNNVQRCFRVRYDSQEGDCFVVMRTDGSTRVFRPTDKGLYVSQVTGQNRETVMVSTVEQNKQEYTRREVRRAGKARRLLAIIGRPSEQKLMQIVRNGQLRNCDISEQDIKNARHIFGPDVGSMKGKTTRRKEGHVEMKMRPVPASLMERHKEVIVCFDLMYLNGTAFLVSISRGIRFCTAEAVDNRRSDTILTGLKRIKMIYARRGFLVNRIAADNEFAPLETELSGCGITLNTVSRDEHVPEVERHIRTLKERCRATYNALPFKKWPTRLVVELVYAMTFWIHAFPADDGVSATISPRELVTGIGIDSVKHCMIPYGAYVQTHEEHDNTMTSRTIGALALRPTGNAQGGHYFYSLQTGRRIVRNNWTEVPMPADVIDRVTKMAENKAVNRLVFGDRENVELAEDDEISFDSETDEDDQTDASAPSSGEDEPDEADEETDEHLADEHEYRDAVKEKGLLTGIKPEPVDELDHHASLNDEELPQSDGEPTNEANGTGGEQPGVEEEIAHDGGTHAVPSEQSTRAPQSGRVSLEDDEGAGVSPQGAERAEISLEEEMDSKYGARKREGMRRRRMPNYNVELLAQAHSHVVAPSFDATRLASLDPGLEPLISVVLTQYGMKKGLKLFGEEGDSAIQAEMQQIHDREVMIPRSPVSLNRAERRKALRYLMFLKKKRDGKVKGRGCADGRKQRLYIDKCDASSPTISTEAVFLIIMVAAKEERDVAIVDIPGAFLHTKLEGETVIVRFDGRMAEILAVIDPKLYLPHITMENGKPVLYGELKKVLYGMLQAALKFWEQISEDLVGLGYEINPYDWCVANKLINGKQHTIGWHVDDFVMTHEDPAVNNELISWFSEKYGKLSPLTVHRGRVHNYLGMTLDFTTKGEVRVTMFDYIERMLTECPTPFEGNANTPAAKHLFETDDRAKKLNGEDASVFHHIVAQMVFLCKRARPDIQLSVGFLSTRVKAPDTDDWKKLRRVVQYLRSTREMPLTLEADESRIVKWWVDSSFAVHQDMRSHSGGAMSLGGGVAFGGSTKQKINTRSSTEAELVAANDFMPQILWTRYFLQAQGYEVSDNVLFQDNQSAMLLETHGRGSSSKRTRHINVRYFFITDRIKGKEISVRHCPAENMVGDFFTKPLQGASFRKFRDIVLNIK